MTWRRISDHLSIIFLLSHPLGSKETRDKMTGVGVDLIRVEGLLGPSTPYPRGREWEGSTG